MKKFLLFFALICVTLTANAQEIKWMTFSEALKAQEKKPKPIFVDVYTDWCGPCKMLDKNTFSDASFIEHINKNYYAVKFNAEGNEEIAYKGKKFSNPKYDANRTGRNAIHELTMFLQVPAYPTMLVLDKKGEVTNTIVGYQTADQLLPKL